MQLGLRHHLPMPRIRGTCWPSRLYSTLVTGVCRPVSLDDLPGSSEALTLVGRFARRSVRSSVGSLIGRVENVLEKDNMGRGGRLPSAAVAAIAFRLGSFDGLAVRSRSWSKVVDRSLRWWLGLPQDDPDDK